MKDIREYIKEAISSKRTGKYAPESNKKSIIDWLDANGFKRYFYAGDPNVHTKRSEKSYLVGPNNHIESTNWVSAHTKDVFELVIWFDRHDDFDSADLRKNDDAGTEISEQRAMEILVSM